MTCAAFIDKDGTLLTNVPYNVDPAEVEFMPHAVDGLRRLQADGYSIVLVSNQPGVGLGRFSQCELDALGAWLRTSLQDAGVALAGFYCCPHEPNHGCGCRKPSPGLLLRAAAELGLHLRASWMLGDILDDVEAGKRAGCRSLLIDNGGETEWRSGRLRVPDIIAPDLRAAALAIADAA
jgi:D-glycero-D-manno-heptose 1,7-bisphosphate phosphatase